MTRTMCPRCQGAGAVPIPSHLEETLASVRAGRTTAVAIRTATLDPVTVNAISNRLADLFRLGLVKRHREGKFWHYTIQPVKKTKANVR